jgi:hypothetical protein
MTNYRIKGMTWVPDNLTPDSKSDPDLRRYVDEGRRQTALELAVELAKGWDRADDADAVVRDAATFEAFIRDGQSPTAHDAPTTSLIDFLACVHDLDVRTWDGKISVYNKQGGHTMSTLPLAFARAAEQAGLVTEDDTGRWLVTSRGSEAIDRGQV